VGCSAECPTLWPAVWLRSRWANDVDALTAVAYDERAARANLGCIRARPETVAEGWWILLEDDEGHAVACRFVGLVFDSAAASVDAASEILRRSGYDRTETTAGRPWSNQWRIIGPEDRWPA
jgi:hypothetical protein